MTKRQKVYYQLSIPPIPGDAGRHPPMVHIARGFDHHLPFLQQGRRPLICISDWQFETSTQRQWWKNTLPILLAELNGNTEWLQRALVLVAGDMASSNNELMGSASDDVPVLDWLHDSFPQGDVFMIYGNHDNISQDHLTRVNAGSSNLPCLLPHGEPILVPLLRPTRKHDQVGTAKGNSNDDGKNSAAKKYSTIQESCNVTNDEVHRRNRTREDKVAITPGMTKQERAAQYAKVKFEKLPKQPKVTKQTIQWRKQNPQQARLADTIKKNSNGPTAEKKKISKKTTTTQQHPTTRMLRLGGVHGIPASHDEGLKKIQRTSYFDTLSSLCGEDELDVLVTHSNPRLPGQERKVKGEDAGRIYQEFCQSSARLLVHGHMHTDPVVSVVQDGKIVVNSDCRVVMFIPDEMDNNEEEEEEVQQGQQKLSGSKTKTKKKTKPQATNVRNTTKATTTRARTTPYPNFDSDSIFVRGEDGCCG
mmetsp:Transcript_16679/g.25191  ORF Transcript_16679/g.25191 Transcript_16679/m.25191 type:complete len:476 (+) Transcript_16679:158-1585(+)